MLPSVQKIGLRRRGKPVKERVSPATLGNNHAECGSRELPWYVVQVHSRQLILATRNMQRQGFGTYVPLVESPPTKKQPDPTYRPLFPGYAFVTFDEHAQRWQALFSSYGVKRVMMMSGLRPVQLSSQAIQLATNPTIPFTAKPIYEPGQRLRITAGALAGHHGTLLAMSDETRCRLLVALLNRELEIDIPYMQVTGA